MKRQMFLFRDLTCPSCAAKLEASVRKIQGVMSATVSFATGSLTVEYDETVVTPEQIAQVARALDLAVASIVDRPRG
ncbi:MAG TPA: heavy-metal-associated domain-containing protein [Thermaerobacter sp.]